MSEIDTNRNAVEVLAAWNEARRLGWTFVVGNEPQNTSATLLALLTRAETAEQARDQFLALAEQHMDEKHRAKQQAKEDWNVLQTRIKETEAQRDAALLAVDKAKQFADDAISTLNAWFDLEKKIENQGTEVLKSSLETWLRTALNGGMPTEHADIVRTIIDEAAQTYLWRALVPVLRGMTESVCRASAEVMRENAARRVRSFAISEGWSGTSANRLQNTVRSLPLPILDHKS
jgi:hypothetical protein